jgi:hypothetical protein
MVTEAVVRPVLRGMAVSLSEAVVAVVAVVRTGGLRP